MCAVSDYNMLQPDDNMLGFVKASELLPKPATSVPEISSTTSLTELPSTSSRLLCPGLQSDPTPSDSNESVTDTLDVSRGGNIEGMVKSTEGPCPSPTSLIDLENHNDYFRSTSSGSGLTRVHVDPNDLYIEVSSSSDEDSPSVPTILGAEMGIPPVSGPEVGIPPVSGPGMGFVVSRMESGGIESVSGMGMGFVVSRMESGGIESVSGMGMGFVVSRMESGGIESVSGMGMGFQRASTLLVSPALAPRSKGSSTSSSASSIVKHTTVKSASSRGTKCATDSTKPLPKITNFFGK